MNKLYRQGDVLFRRVRAASRPPEATIRKDGIVMQGEATGHAHRIEDLKKAELYDVGNDCYLAVSDAGGVSIVHEEHGPILLPPGLYEVRRQREYSPEEIRNVID